MLRKYFTYICFISVVFFLAIFSNFSYAGDKVVYVNGQVDCSDHYSERCGWGNLGDNGGVDEGGGGGGGGTGGGGGGSSNTDDGTTGTTMDFNRFNPGCLGEVLAIADLVAKVNVTGAPVGIYVPLTLGDPAYDNGEWEKWETNVILDTWIKPDTFSMQKRIRIHYIFNKVTHATSQVKLKNSYQSGCKRVVKSK